MKKCPNCAEEMPVEHDICWNCNFDLIEKKTLSVEKLEEEEVVYKDINCLRCDVKLDFLGNRNFHEGRRWGVIGELGHLLINKESFDLYICPKCNKIEFYGRDMIRTD